MLSFAPTCTIADPFARVLLFEGRRLIEQKQTTITTNVGNFAFRQKKDVIFSESFLFHMPLVRLGHCHVVIEVIVVELIVKISYPPTIFLRSVR